MRSKCQHLYGPVLSRRFGRSLGVDLTPFKTCTFDCIFCQLGHTTRRTVVRRPYVLAGKVIEGLDDWLAADGCADYIALAGSGEPTLNSDFGEIIEYAARTVPMPVALLTNGSLLCDPDVRAGAAQAHVVKVSISAGDSFMLDHINRPHRGVVFKKLIEGLWQFRDEFKGKLWVEVFLVWGANTSVKDVTRIAELVRSLKPEKVHLNTAVRPPCEGYAYAVPESHALALRRFFDPPAEVIADYCGEASARNRVRESDIFNMLKRRPCTLEQICRVFGLHRNEASKYLGKLLRAGRVREQRNQSDVYYSGAGNGVAMPVRA